MKTTTLPAMLLSLALPALAPAAGPAGPAADVAGDLAKFQGRWATHAGAKGKVAVLLEFQGRQVTARITTPQGLEVLAEGSLRIDEAATPKALDWVEFTSPDGAELPQLRGIYEFDGEALRIRNAALSDPRPVAFQPGEGPLAAVLVFRRPAAEAPAGAPKSSGPPVASAAPRR